ncbi:MAG TPA: hypothetical protein VGO71_18480 [Baekduia sp.]|jgi:hypothetical protein|nr:hypothetical protein [Baekduia sp.]
MSSRRAPLPASAAAVAAAVLVVAASAAQAATVSLDRPCYVGGQPMIASGTAFSPGAPVMLGGYQQFPAVTADPAGNFRVGLIAPPSPKLGARGSVPAKLTVTDLGPLAQTASADYRLVNFDVDRGTSRDPRTTRTWHFSGFATGTVVYGHVRLKGRTVANHRFGTATGECGMLHARAAGIPVPGVHAGAWTVQVDGHQHYAATTRPALVLKISVFVR